MFNKPSGHRFEPTKKACNNKLIQQQERRVLVQNIITLFIPGGILVAYTSHSKTQALIPFDHIVLNTRDIS